VTAFAQERSPGGLSHPSGDLSGAALAGFASRLAAEPDRWRHLVRHDADARVYEVIWSDAHVNAWVICWSPGQDTGFHDHGQSAGGIHVVDGRISEERLVLQRPSDPRTSGPGPIPRTFGPGSSFHVPSCAIHRVFHGGWQPAVSIHAYSPPLSQMGDYTFAPDGALERAARPCAVPSPTA
jgi:Cysteine dioxygenase type I